MASDLLKVAGFDTADWSENTRDMVGRKVRAHLPNWAVFLVERYGWHWPISINGVTTTQINLHKNYQLLRVEAGDASFECKGLVK